MPAPRSSVTVVTTWLRSPAARCARRGACSLLVLLTGLASCRIGGETPLTGLPGWKRCQVESVVERAGVLDVSLVEDQQMSRFYFPADATCRALLVPGASVEYVRTAPWGVVRQGDQVCAPAGIGSLD